MHWKSFSQEALDWKYHYQLTTFQQLNYLAPGVINNTKLLSFLVKYWTNKERNVFFIVFVWKSLKIVAIYIDDNEKFTYWCFIHNRRLIVRIITTLHTSYLLFIIIMLNVPLTNFENRQFLKQNYKTKRYCYAIKSLVKRHSKLSQLHCQQIMSLISFQKLYKISIITLTRLIDFGC